MLKKQKKTTGQISSSTSTYIHPSSRKAAQLQRAALRKDRVERIKSKKFNEGIQPLIDRILWFKYALDDSIPCATKNENRPKSSAKEDLLKALKSKEKREYIEGFEIPNLMDSRNVKTLREWDGDPNSIQIKQIEEGMKKLNYNDTPQEVMKQTIRQETMVLD
ncbi:2191_t:CDS:2 [Diversispora eburnea]|uniref:2191_t:CDS:1 n=1 Tax=Diversispora eburnea TaxID=1213867 RepID=A0A9N8WDH3_9GLOM|nr:2191_t:CDS:2 [Diversispora eburnea]